MYKRQIMGSDVMFIGFTGTPLLHEEKKKGGYAQYTKVANESAHRFGPFIHKYLHKEAVDDICERTGQNDVPIHWRCV